ncbi:ADP-ribose pyrophosphatase [Thalassovita gelatinovora]|uniref:Putative gamma-glutamylcyclotransferase n=1 Tax=Thalassovita gelatinovora TaxID=53501 RepID=A0A0P1G3N2_THAGE|nr:gamma-glutamylcyclotransferase [Thalassovita gelatinovora]QIZ79132.1 NUDIX domain-containing protein [Thalassovita gelatinovora]CUH68797.1 ADP-ribose pyrophosphatase [Thalassovita gelatinovora]SEQ58952.1 nudix-type nucleoside diphosphatase, YffH/AdpP family [Thalassovita gelatinovora]
MTDIFVYGTLRHLPLLETVLGRATDHLSVSRARLQGYRTCLAKGQAFPLIFAEDGQAAEGILLRGLSATDLDRLDYYEKVFGYNRGPVRVEGDGGPIEALIWWPPENEYKPGADFDLEQWADKWGRINCRAADEVMGYKGQKNPLELGRIYGMIHARAASWVLARDEMPVETPSGLTEDDVVAHGLTRPYANYFSVEEQRLQFRRFDGGLSEEVLRATFVATDAALVLPYDPVHDRVLLLEQFRAGPWTRGDHCPWQIEPIAGRVDAGESPEDCARREALEESGLVLKSLIPIHLGYASPGCSSEFYHIYLGLADLADHESDTGGMISEDEDIRSHILNFNAAMALLDQGRIRVTPMALALNWLARKRDGLRAEA